MSDSYVSDPSPISASAAFDYIQVRFKAPTRFEVDISGQVLTFHEMELPINRIWGPVLIQVRREEGCVVFVLTNRDVSEAKTRVQIDFITWDARFEVEEAEALGKIGFAGEAYGPRLWSSETYPAHRSRETKLIELPLLGASVSYRHFRSTIGLLVAWLLLAFWLQQAGLHWLMMFPAGILIAWTAVECGLWLDRVRRMLPSYRTLRKAFRRVMRKIRK